MTQRTEVGRRSGDAKRQRTAGVIRRINMCIKSLNSPQRGLQHDRARRSVALYPHPTSVAVNTFFAHRKATQALNFLAHKAGGKISKLRALKLIFLADRYHLRKYGRAVTNDAYYALKLGPVPSDCKNLAELHDALPAATRTYAARYLRPLDAKSYAALGEPDATVFSASDVEALEFAWGHFGRARDLVEVTHKYPGWQRHEASLAAGAKRIKMTYDDLLEDAPQDPGPKLTPDMLRVRQEQVREQDALQRILAG